WKGPAGTRGVRAGRGDGPVGRVALRGDADRGVGTAQAVQLRHVPLGVFRPLQEPLEPLVHDGLLRQPRKSPALQAEEEVRLLPIYGEVARRAGGAALIELPGPPNRTAVT